MAEIITEEQLVEQLRGMGLDRKYDFPGVYSISIGDKLAYIGKSRNMLKRLAQHIIRIEYPNRSNKYKVLNEAYRKQMPIQFDVLYTYEGEQNQELIDQAIGVKEGEEIRKYLPPLNIQIPLACNWHQYYYNRIAKTITLDQLLEFDNHKKIC